MSDNTDETTAVDTTAEGDTQQTSTPDVEGLSTDADDKDGVSGATPEGSDSESDPETFPRSYVEKLRRESAGYRERATKGDTYAQRLHTELVRATGKLADPTDLAFDEDHLADTDKLAAAIDDLLTRKPHLASRRPAGDIGQGAVSGAGSSVDLAAILRQRAG